jgi:hypothetical protein
LILSWHEKKILVKKNWGTNLPNELTFYNGIDWARFLTEPAIDALGHIDVWTRSYKKRRVYLETEPAVFCGSSRTVHTRLAFNGNCLGWADSLTEFAGCDHVENSSLPNFSEVLTNTSFLSAGVSAESVLSTEAGRQRSLLKGIRDSVRRPEELLEHNPHPYMAIRSRESQRTTANGPRRISVKKNKWTALSIALGPSL